MAKTGTEMPAVFETLYAALDTLWAMAKTGTVMLVVLKPVYAVLNTLGAMAETRTETPAVFKPVYAVLNTLGVMAETRTEIRCLHACVRCSQHARGHGRHPRGYPARPAAPDLARRDAGGQSHRCELSPPGRGRAAAEREPGNVARPDRPRPLEERTPEARH